MAPAAIHAIGQAGFQRLVPDVLLTGVNDVAVKSRAQARNRLVFAAVAVIGIAVIAHRYLGGVIGDPQTLAARVQSLPGAAAWFVVIYAVGASLALPATPFTLVGGVVFGVAKGSLLNWLGANIGATGSFLLARWLGADSARALLGKHAEKLSWLTYDAKLMTIIRLRLIPVVPFDGLSVAAGLAGVPLRSFVLGTAIGIIPGTLIYTWFAQSLFLGSSEASRSAFIQLAMAGTLLVLLSFLPNIVARMGNRSSGNVKTSDTNSD